MTALIKTEQAACGFRRQVLRIYLGLVIFNLAAWGWAWLALDRQPLLLGMALLAYALGLRHAVDADHIAAIDNVTRRMLQQGRSPLGVGPCFALGHSTVVMVMFVLVATASATLSSHFERIRNLGSVVGPCVSAAFLLLLAGANLATFAALLRSMRAMRRGMPPSPETMDRLLQPRGPLVGLFGPLLRLASRSWHLYPVGILFGLGFDTATEIALFGLSASQSSRGLSPAALLCLPALFAAGMTLIDTTDGVLMTGVYRWASVDPARRIHYNMTVTLVSVIVALVIGGVEVLAMVAERFSLDHGVWHLAGRLASHFGLLGYAVIAVFLASWLVAVLICRGRGEGRVDAAATS